MAREDLEVPRATRAEVIERDASCCRVCGQFVRYPALHHIDYRGQGGGHRLDNLIVIGWLFDHDCHLPVVHANKRLWQPILEIVVASPAAVTALQVRRQLELAGQLRPEIDNARSREARAQLEEVRQRRWAGDKPKPRAPGASDEAGL